MLNGVEDGSFHEEAGIEGDHLGHTAGPVTEMSHPSVRRAFMGHIKEVSEGETLNDPRLRELVDELQAIPENLRVFDGRVVSGVEIANAIPNVDLFLEERNRLSCPKIWGLAPFQNGQLIFGEEHLAQSKDRLGMNYHQRRTDAYRITYRGEDGLVGVLEGDGHDRNERGNIILPDGSVLDNDRILTSRGLAHFDDFERRERMIQAGVITLPKWLYTSGKVQMWSESGKDPSEVTGIETSKGRCYKHKLSPEIKYYDAMHNRTEQWTRNSLWVALNLKKAER